MSTVRLNPAPSSRTIWAESHLFTKTTERVTITPEYSPPATKDDYWIPLRPATDIALFLGISPIAQSSRLAQ